jgi:hypothetical protein
MTKKSRFTPEAVLAVLEDCTEPVSPGTISYKLGGTLSGGSRPNRDEEAVHNILCDLYQEGLVTRLTGYRYYTYEIAR